MLILLALLALQDRVPPPRMDPCREYSGLGYGVGYGPAVPRQGETIELIPMFVRFHGMPPEPVPSECASDWRIEGKGVRRVHGNKLRIDRKAAAGSEIRFSAQIGGQGGGRGYGSFKVIAAGQEVLSGRFSVVKQEGCETAKIAEMTFSAQGDYTYTLPQDMYETKVTGSGAYRWDSASGRLELGGREEPFRARRTGTARRIEGNLVLDGIDPGGWSPQCRITLAAVDPNRPRG